MENNLLIKCEQLVARTTNYSYSGNPLDMIAYRGSVINILGPDYSGKSDWLKTITGINEPVLGELSLLGKNTRDLDRSDWVRVRTKLAYVRPDAALLSAANALQNIMMPASYHRLGSPAVLKDKALALLEDINADCDYEILPAYLRSDQQYKVAVARALILEPWALVLDNPFALLDASAAVEFKLFLLNLVRNSNMLVILVTHDIKFASKHSDQILFVTREQVHHFSQGKDFLSSNIPEISNYLDKSLMT